MHLPRARHRGFRAALLAACVACGLLACDFGSDGDDSGDADMGAGPGSGTATTQTLAWTAASGPVAGYRVWVQRNGGTFEAEADVPQPQVTLSGEPGETARIVVAAFAGDGTVGPLSPPSTAFTFAEEVEAGASAATATATSTAPLRSVAAASSPSSGASTATTTDAADAATAPVSPADKALWDANGDLVADLLWQAGDMLRLTTAALETELVFARPAPDAAVAALGDFDGDGLADPLWVTAAGRVGYSPMAALRDGAAATPFVDLGMLGTSEDVVGTGDFDGDGLVDVLLRAASDGFTTLWLSNPGAAPDRVGLGAITDAVAGVADYDADGNADILWRTPQGSLVVWRMSGAAVEGALEVSLPPTAELLASGDFNGDGAAELAHRDPATGIVSLLRPVLGATGGTTALGDTRGWTPLGAADLDGDGTADLLLEGDAALWIAYLPGDELVRLDPSSPWSPVPLPR